MYRYYAIMRMCIPARTYTYMTPATVWHVRKIMLCAFCGGGLRGVVHWFGYGSIILKIMQFAIHVIIDPIIPTCAPLPNMLPDTILISIDCKRTYRH